MTLVCVTSINRYHGGSRIHAGVTFQQWSMSTSAKLLDLKYTRLRTPIDQSHFLELGVTSNE
jgi:hypothetical protein